MKKSILAVSIIAVLGVAYVGTSWYTGNIIEQRLDGKLTQFTNLVNQQQQLFAIEVSYSNYQKGIFSTKLRLTIHAESLQDVDSIYDEEPQVIFDDNITIYHGPFPWSEVKSINFMPQMAGLYYEMDENSNPKLWQLTEQKPYLISRARVDYSENINILANTLPITYLNSLDNTRYDISAGSLNLSTNKDLSQLSLKVVMDNFDIRDEYYRVTFSKFKANLDPLNGTENLGYELSTSLDSMRFFTSSYYGNTDILLNNLVYSTTFESNNDLGFINKNALTIDKVSVTENESKTTINEISITNNNTSTDNQNIFGSANYAVGSLFYGKQNIGFGEAKLAYENLPITYVSFLANTFVNNDVEYTPSGDIKLTAEPFFWENAKGRMEMNFSTVISDSDLANNDALEHMNVESIKQLNFSLNLPFDVISYAMAQTDNPEKKDLTKDELEAAKNTLSFLASMLKNFKLLEVQDYDTDERKAGIYSNLSYDKNKNMSKINNRPVQSNRFFNMLGNI